MNWLGHPEEDQADVVAEKAEAARILSVGISSTKSVEMYCSGVVVDERVLGRRILVQLVAEFLGVFEHDGNIVDVGNWADNEASEAKAFGGIGRLLRQATVS